MRFGLLATAGWLVAAVLTVVVSWSAVGVVRNAVSPAPAVAQNLPTPDETSAAPSPSATESRTPTPAPTTPGARTASLSGRGGSVAFRCSGGAPELVNATAYQGYTARRDDDGTEVEFESSAGRTEFKASCTGGVPRITVEEKGARGGGGGDDDDNSGRGVGNSGSGGGNSGSGGGNSGRGGGDDD